jgi:hypothetical protein
MVHLADEERWVAPFAVWRRDKVVQTLLLKPKDTLPTKTTVSLAQTIMYTVTAEWSKQQNSSTLVSQPRHTANTMALAHHAHEKTSAARPPRTSSTEYRNTSSATGRGSVRHLWAMTVRARSSCCPTDWKRWASLPC